MDTIRVFLVDDHQVVREGLQRMLEIEADIKVVGEAADAQEALRQVELLSPEIVLMDINMPKMNGVELARQLKERHKSCSVIMLTFYDEYLPQAMDAGASGYLQKDIGREGLIRAIRAVHEGRSPFNLAVSQDQLPQLTASVSDGRHSCHLKDVPAKIAPPLQSKLPNMIENKLLPDSTEERRLLQELSHKVLADINPTGPYERIPERYMEVRRGTDGIINAMSLVIEARDPYTASHQQRVADLSYKIAREMNLPEWDREGIRILGRLHDIGKTAVPAEILCKPGEVSRPELNIIKTHPQVGYDILKGIEFPWPIAQGILQHHERLDGSGYPEGLSAKDIIMEAKILAVADVVEAMSSHRPYRPALGLNQALEEISRKRGLLYDAEVVDACIRLFQKSQAGGKAILQLAHT
jgi:putative nucleotidyltransferase with HDIG domain